MADAPTNKELEQAKLTAYAMGELDEAAAAEVELWLSGDEAARKYVDLVRQEAQVIGRAYHARSAALTDAQHEALDAAIGSEPTPSVLKALGIAAGVAAAACIAIFLFLLPGGGTEDPDDGLSQRLAQIDVDGEDRLAGELSRQTGGTPAQPIDEPLAPGLLAEPETQTVAPAPTAAFFGSAGSAKGKAAKVVEQIGAVNAIKRTSRHADTPLISTPHAARWTFPVDYEWADLDGVAA